jgi:TolB protein
MPRSDEVQVQVSNASEGVYFFELLVTDASGLSDRDTVKVTVERVIQAPPCTDCRIVFVSNRDGNDEIYSCESDGSDVRRLTNNPAAESEPAWSPGGAKIAFISDRSGSHELYIMNADGSGVERRSTSISSPASSPSWSPDGRRIAYAGFSNGSMNIWIVDATIAGATPILLKDIQGWEAFPSWSPDGRSITFTGDQHAYDFVYDIWRINTDGTNLVSLMYNLFDGIDYVISRWSPDGVKLAVVIMETSGAVRIAHMSPDGTAITTLVSGAFEWTRLSWSPDASRILYTVPNGTGKSVAWVAYNGSGNGILLSNGWDADWMH